MNLSWHHYLCEYYNVTPEEALALGSRSKGRKPSLPGSPTCQAVSDMSYEDIWDMNERKTTEGIFQFYKDQGAWSTFRQCVRHKDMENLHIAYFQFLIQQKIFKPGCHICEYGSGIAPFMTTFLKYLGQESKDIDMKISIADVDCEHFNFAKYRLSEIKKEKSMQNLELNFHTITPDELPSFKTNLDALFCFEVLEHVPSPRDVINNIKDSMNTGGFYIENFIKHEADEKEDDGPDLLSARNERDAYYEIVKNDFRLIHPQDISTLETNPNETRIWQKR